MPSIKQRTGLNLKGFEPLELSPRLFPIATRANPTNPMIRTPLPPMNADPDSLRQFDESGAVPTRRVIPLPSTASSSSGGTTTVITNVISPTTSGGVSSTTLAISSLTVSVPALPAGGNFVTTVKMAKAFQIFQLVSTQALEVRLYGSVLAQGADISRTADSSPAFETTSGIITDVIFDTAPYKWNWQNRIGANADPTQTSTGYITVLNPSTSGIPAATLTLVYLPLLS